MSDPKTDSIFDSLLSDLGPDPDTALSEDELNDIAGSPSEAPVTTIETAAPEAPVTTIETAAPDEIAEQPAEKPKRGRPRKVAEAAPDETPEQPALTGLIVGVDLSPQTLAEMEAGRKALSRAQIA